jgi:predicted PurR-regulated permease PerM
VSKPTKSGARISGWPIAAALAVLCIFLYYVRAVLLPFVIAGALGFVLSPVVDALHSRFRRLPRWGAALLVYIVVLACMAAAGYWLVPVIAADFADLANHAPELLHRLVGYFAVDGRIVLLGQSFDADAAVNNLLETARSYLLGPGAITVAAIGVGGISALVLVLVLLAYFLISGPRLGRGLVWLVPPNHRPEMRRLAIKVAPVLRRYFAGLVLVVLYTSTVAWIVLTMAFGLPHAPLLAVTVGILELIPVIGPALSIALIGLAAVQQTSLPATMGLVAFAVGLRLSIDQLVGPLILGRAVYLHPVVIIFAFLSGAVFLGVLGLVLAVPVAATIKIVLSHYYEDERIA